MDLRTFTYLALIFFSCFFFPFKHLMSDSVDYKQHYLLPFVLTWTWGRLFYLWRRSSGSARAAWRTRSCWRWGRRPAGRRWRGPTASPGSDPTPQSCSWRTQDEITIKEKYHQWTTEAQKIKFFEKILGLVLQRLSAFLWYCSHMTLQMG